MADRVKQNIPEDFPIALALVDAIPVLLFGISVLIMAGRLQNILFVVGASVITLAGCGKVLWKLILAVWKKNIQWLNRYYVPCQIVVFLLAVVGLAVGFATIRWATILKFPRILFCLAWLTGLCTMGWYRKKHFDNSTSANWTAQIINSVTQTALLIAVLL